MKTGDGFIPYIGASFCRSRIAGALCICLITAALLFVVSCSRDPVYPEAHRGQDSVTIDVRSLPEGKPVFYSFSSGEKKINYFVLRTGGGVESYFDACAECYGKRRGFTFDGKGLIVCRACNVSYGADELKGGIGSCYPITLAGKLEGDRYIILNTDIIRGERLF